MKKSILPLAAAVAGFILAACASVEYQGESLPALHSDAPVKFYLASELEKMPADIAEQLEIEGIYQGYLARQAQDIVAFKKEEALIIPEDFDYAHVGGLSNEIVERLQKERPSTIGAMTRMRGITPASINSLQPAKNL